VFLNGVGRLWAIPIFSSTFQVAPPSVEYFTTNADWPSLVPCWRYA
jgi:hypothetical protein